MPYLRVKNELPLIPGYSEGAIAYAPDAADAPLNECICYINPEQSGSGDPSPSNVRTITGHPDLNLVQKDGNDTVVHTYTTDLGTTVYGGTLDVVSGVLTIDRAEVDLGSLSWTKEEVYGFVCFRTKKNDILFQSDMLCEIYKSYSGGIAQLPDNSIFASNSQELLLLRIRDSRFDNYDATQVATALDGVKLVYPLATPTTTQLTPQEVKSLLGSNNFYHDCNGDTKITYIRRLDS